MFKTTKGLILREVKYKEADRILTVLTEDMGKITVKARGALRKGSKVAAATQLFAFSELTMFENKGRWSVNEGSTIEEFKGLRNDASGVELIEKLASFTGNAAPAPLCGLDKRPVRFETVIEKQAMKQAVTEFLK